MRKTLCAIWITLFTLAASAQTEMIETDRPGYTNIPTTTPKNWVQIESGLLRQVDKFNPPYRDILIQHPSLITKYGIGKRIELRLITDFGTIIEEAMNATSSVSGLTNLQVGGKLNFLKEKGLIPKTSIIAHYNFLRFKMIVNAFDSIDGANFRFAMEHTLPHSLRLGYNVGMQWRSFPSEPAYLYTISPKVIIDEKWLIFAEFFGYAWKKRKPENSVDVGFGYSLNTNLRIDASAGFGINKNAPDRFYAIGASFRFHKQH